MAWAQDEVVVIEPSANLIRTGSGRLVGGRWRRLSEWEFTKLREAPQSIIMRTGWPLHSPMRISNGEDSWSRGQAAWPTNSRGGGGGDGCGGVGGDGWAGVTGSEAGGS